MNKDDSEKINIDGKKNSEGKNQDLDKIPFISICIVKTYLQVR